MTWEARSQRGGAHSAGSAYHASIGQKARERLKLETDAGVLCDAGPECAGFKNGVALPANPRLSGKCGTCHQRMLTAAAKRPK
jgi:hypothetical protein